MSKILLESPVFSFDAAIQAASFGVDRLELCSNFPEGGETPSAGMLKILKSELDLPIFVMIRPRGGDFAYSQKELMVMKRDIEILGELGADGFVFGVLDVQGNVNMDACESLMRSASGKPCTFHRAIDAAKDLSEALDAIISCKFQRILTSGGKNSVEEGLPILLNLLNTAKDRVSIMPGGGTTPAHVKILQETGYLKEIHASCKSISPSNNQYINQDLSFSAYPIDFSNRMEVDGNLVNQFLEVLG